MQGTAPGYILTQVQVEQEIYRLAGLLERNTYSLENLAREAADADWSYKGRWAGEMVGLVDRQGQDGVKESEAVRVARVDVRVQEEYQRKRLAEGLERACRDACNSLRAQLSAMQTISSNIRGQT